MLQIHIVYCGVNWLFKFTRWEGCKYSINQVWYAEYQPWNYITFHFSKIGKMVRNQICLDTHTNMYLVAKYTNAVFSRYTVGYVKIQVWESRKFMFGERKIPVCWPVTKTFFHIIILIPKVFAFIPQDPVLMEDGKEDFQETLKYHMPGKIITWKF